MRFFEFEAREIVKRAGIPVTDYGFTTDPAEARAIAERIGGPTVIKSQVLTGGRMKAGGVKFADTPDEAEAFARDILALEIGGQMPRGVLEDHADDPVRLEFVTFVHDLNVDEQVDLVVLGRDATADEWLVSAAKHFV